MTFKICSTFDELTNICDVHDRLAVYMRVSVIPAPDIKLLIDYTL